MSKVGDVSASKHRLVVLLLAILTFRLTTALIVRIVELALIAALAAGFVCMSWPVTVATFDVVVAEFFLQSCNVFSVRAFLIVGLILIELAVLISPLLAALLFYYEVCFFVEGAR